MGRPLLLLALVSTLCASPGSTQTLPPPQDGELGRGETLDLLRFQP